MFSALLVGLLAFNTAHQSSIGAEVNHAAQSMVAAAHSKVDQIVETTTESHPAEKIGTDAHQKWQKLHDYLYGEDAAPDNTEGAAQPTPQEKPKNGKALSTGNRSLKHRQIDAYADLLVFTRAQCKAPDRTSENYLEYLNLVAEYNQRQMAATAAGDADPALPTPLTITPDPSEGMCPVWEELVEHYPYQ